MIYWAKTDPVLQAGFDGRVSSRLPAPDERTYPWLRCFDIPAAGPNKEYAVAQPLLQWDIFGARKFDDRTVPDFDTASDLAGVLADRLRMFDGATTEFDPSARRIEWAAGRVVIISGVSIAFGPGRQTDIENLARYRIDTIVRAKAG